MESLAMMRELLRQDDWMASIDLKDAYLSVTIWEDHHKYLWFQWQGSTYEFHCLPFGLSSTSHVFTKLMKLVVARERGFLSTGELARLIGKMTATLPVDFLDPLWYREL